MTIPQEPSTPAQRVLAITLNWRQPEITLACVQALQEMAYPGLDILVIDNGSGDNSVKQLQDELPTEVMLLCLPKNIGFAAGNNVGLRQAISQNYPYALLINNDAFATPDMLRELLKGTAPDIALLSPKIFYAADRERVWFAGGQMNSYTLDMQKTGRGELDGAMWQTSRDVDYLLGTCLLVNLSAVEQVGLLDEIFFMYFEDLDWSLRLRQAGMRLRLVASAHLYHAIAVSGGGLESPTRRYFLARSGVIFWRRYLSQGNALAIISLRITSASKNTLQLLAHQNIAALKAYWRGLKNGWQISSKKPKEKG